MGKMEIYVMSAVTMSDLPLQQPKPDPQQENAPGEIVEQHADAAEVAATSHSLDMAQILHNEELMKIILAFLLLIPIFMSAAILQVSLDGSQPYTSVQAAVNAAAEQDTILVHPGRYFENIEISGRHLTIGSLELTTADSTYITQTTIDGNQSGSCFNIWGDANITLQGLYMTNGSGTPSPTWGDKQGGAVYVYESTLSVINCRIIDNRAMAGAGIQLQYSSGYLAGTTIAYNWGKHSGALTFGGYSSIEKTLDFDSDNRCSIYCNYATQGNDIFIGSQYMTNIDIYLDKFTIPGPSPYLGEYIHAEHYEFGCVLTYTLHYNTAVLSQQFADLYVSPDGDDDNSGMSVDEPLKTTALAMQKIGTDSLRPHTIHLANGSYGADQHFPLNLRSYVSIVGESEEGVIFSGPDIFFLGWDSEKEVTIRNITFDAVTDQEFYQYKLIDCSSRNKINGVLDKFSLTLENLSFRNCRPMHYDNFYELGEFVYPERLVLRNITVEDCMGSIAFNFWGGDIYAENIRIHHFYAPPSGERYGIAFAITTNNPEVTCGDNIISNLHITGCVANSVDGSLSSVVRIQSTFMPTTFNSYFLNATITDNAWATGYGAAIILGEDAKATFINSIISNEVGLNFLLPRNDLPSHLRFLNCLVGPSDNPWDTILSLSPNNTIEWYGNNLSSNPGFYAYSPDNPYTLGQNSPCIDAGTTDFSMFNLADWYQLPAIDLAGDPRIYGDQIDLGAYEWQGQTGIEDPFLPPLQFALLQNYPNPFNPTTTISYSLPSAAKVRLDIYNLKGQLVKTLIDSDQEAGKHSVIWNGTDARSQSVGSGVYFYSLSSPNQTISKRMLLMK